MTARTLRTALLLLCLAASTAQNWVAQLHFHAAAPAQVAASLAQVPTAGEDSEPGVPQHPDGPCLLCPAASQGVGVLLLASAPAPLEPSLGYFLLPLADQTADGRSSRSHHWSSRGPPHA
jgi:hypothetical protein